jgi:hypothetical protein
MLEREYFDKSSGPQYAINIELINFPNILIVHNGFLGLKFGNKMERSAH